MDADSVMLELNAVRPAEFTAARDAYVAQARQAGDRDLAATIAGLRKPTVASWTAGLLARLRPKEAHQLLQLGEALRGAHRTLNGELLRKLSHDQHVVIGRLARTARSLAAEAGQSVSEPVLHEVEQILHAVLADGDIAARWAAGQLMKAPDAVLGFTGLEPEPGAAPPRHLPFPLANRSPVRRDLTGHTGRLPIGPPSYAAVTLDASTQRARWWRWASMAPTRPVRRRRCPAAATGPARSRRPRTTPPRLLVGLSHDLHHPGRHRAGGRHRGPGDLRTERA